MQHITRKPVTKNKFFIASFALAILCSVVSISLLIYMVVHLDSCLTWNACTEESSGYYDFCVKDGYKYCCGGWGLDYDSCGPYINNCRKKNSGFIDCEATYKAEIAMSWISLFFWICMIVVVVIHRRQQDKMQLAPENYSLVTNQQNQNLAES